MDERGHLILLKDEQEYKNNRNNLYMNVYIIGLHIIQNKLSHYGNGRRIGCESKFYEKESSHRLLDITDVVSLYKNPR